MLIRLGIGKWCLAFIGEGISCWLRYSTVPSLVWLTWLRGKLVRCVLEPPITRFVLREFMRFSGCVCKCENWVFILGLTVYFRAKQILYILL